MNILIIRNNANAAALDASVLLGGYLDSLGIGHRTMDSRPAAAEGDGFSPAAPDGDACAGEGLGMQSFGMVVSLGGDGTILHAARLVGGHRVPILGINFGHLGFLVNSAEDGVVPIVAAALSGDVIREERAALGIELWAEGELVAERFALNEFSVTRGALGRIIDFGVEVAGVHMVDMRADGLVVASATGSTAYALSAGGPLVSPEFQGLIVVPLAPHTLLSRSIVTGSSDVVEVDLSRNSANREATFFADGEIVPVDAPIDRAVIRRASEPVVLLRYKDKGFYAESSKVFFRDDRR